MDRALFCVAFVFLTALSASFAGCGGDADPEIEDAASTPTDTANRDDAVAAEAESEADPIAEGVAQAEYDHEAAIEDARSDLLLVLDDAYDRAADAGNLERVEQIAQMRQAFVEQGQLPADEAFGLAVEQYTVGISDALNALIGAYDLAVIEYTRARRIEDAHAVRSKQQLLLLPAGVTAFDNHYYLVIREHIPWRQAQARCEALGGYLACISSAEEMAFVRGLVEEDDGFWLGATDQGHEGDWRWVDGSRFDYNEWGRNAPNNQNGRQHFLWAKKTGDWDDLWPNTAYVNCFICEWEGAD